MRVLGAAKTGGAEGSTVRPVKRALLVAVVVTACSAPMPTIDAGADAGSEDAGTHEWVVVHDDLPGALLSAWESSDGVLYAVGGTARTAFVLRHDSTGWWQMDPGTSSVLWWVHGFSASDVWAVGANGVVTHFDGTRWTVEREQGPATLFGVYGASRDRLIAVGGVVMLSAPQHAVLTRTAVGWSDVAALPSTDTRPVFKVWGRLETEVFFVGERGLIARGNGTAMTVETSGVTDRLTTVHGNVDETYVVGGLQRPVFLRRTGTSWTPVTIPGSPQLLNGVAVAPDGEVVIVGLGGYVARGRGGTVRVSTTPTEKDLHAVLPTRTGFVAVGGDLVQTLGRGVVLTRGALPGGALRPWPHGGVRLDAGVNDAGADAGSEDAGADGGTADAGTDAGVFDAGVVDAGTFDAGAPDAGPLDAGPLDAGVDAGVADAGLVDGGADGGPLFAGDDCQGRYSDCPLPLQCVMILPPFAFACTDVCMSVSECGAYGAGACCRVPNPQEFRSMCLPARFCDGGS